MEFFKKLYYKIFGLRRVDILRKSLEKYKEEVENGKYYGLCITIYEVLTNYLDVDSCYPSGCIVHQYIPRFGMEFVSKWNTLWWDRFDTESRIAYLEKLIEFYKNDKTNLFNI